MTIDRLIIGIEARNQGVEQTFRQTQEFIRRFEQSVARSMQSVPSLMALPLNAQEAILRTSQGLTKSVRESVGALEDAFRSGAVRDPKAITAGISRALQDFQTEVRKAGGDTVMGLFAPLTGDAIPNAFARAGREAASIFTEATKGERIADRVISGFDQRFQSQRNLFRRLLYSSEIGPERFNELAGRSARAYNDGLIRLRDALDAKGLLTPALETQIFNRFKRAGLGAGVSFGEAFRRGDRQLMIAHNQALLEDRRRTLRQMRQVEAEITRGPRAALRTRETFLQEQRNIAAISVGEYRRMAEQSIAAYNDKIREGARRAFDQGLIDRAAYDRIIGQVRSLGANIQRELPAAFGLAGTKSAYALADAVGRSVIGLGAVMMRPFAGIRDRIGQAAGGLFSRVGARLEEVTREIRPRASALWRSFFDREALSREGTALTLLAQRLRDRMQRAFRDPGRLTTGQFGAMGQRADELIQLRAINQAALRATSGIARAYRRLADVAGQAYNSRIGTWMRESATTIFGSFRGLGSRITAPFRDMGYQSGTAFSHALGTVMTQVGNNIAEHGKRIALTLSTVLTAGIGAAVRQGMGQEVASTRLDIVFGGQAGRLRKQLRDLQKEIPATAEELYTMSARAGELQIQLGRSRESAAGMDIELIKLAKNLALINGIDTARAFNAIEAAMVGQTRALRLLGVTISEADIRRKAMQMGLGAQAATLDSTSRAVASYALILERARIVEGAVAGATHTTTLRWMFLKSQIQDAAATIGRTIMVALNPMIDRLSVLAVAMRDASTEQVQQVVKWTAIVAAIGPALYAIGKLIAAFGALARAGAIAGRAIVLIVAAMRGAAVGASAGPLGAVIGGIIALLIGGGGLVFAIKKAKDAWEGLGIAQAEVARRFGEQGLEEQRRTMEALTASLASLTRLRQRIQVDANLTPEIFGKTAAEQARNYKAAMDAVEQSIDTVRGQLNRLEPVYRRTLKAEEHSRLAAELRGEVPREILDNQERYNEELTKTISTIRELHEKNSDFSAEQQRLDSILSATVIRLGELNAAGQELPGFLIEGGRRIRAFTTEMTNWQRAGGAGGFRNVNREVTSLISTFQTLTKAGQDTTEVRQRLLALEEQISQTIESQGGTATAVARQMNAQWIQALNRIRRAMIDTNAEGKKLSFQTFYNRQVEVIIRDLVNAQRAGRDFTAQMEAARAALERMERIRRQLGPQETLKGTDRDEAAAVSGAALALREAISRVERAEIGNLDRLVRSLDAAAKRGDDLESKLAAVREQMERVEAMRRAMGPDQNLAGEQLATARLADETIARARRSLELLAVLERRASELTDSADLSIRRAQVAVETAAGPEVITAALEDMKTQLRLVTEEYEWQRQNGVENIRLLTKMRDLSRELREQTDKTRLQVMFPNQARALDDLVQKMAAAKRIAEAMRAVGTPQQQREADANFATAERAAMEQYNRILQNLRDMGASDAVIAVVAENMKDVFTRWGVEIDQTNEKLTRTQRIMRGFATIGRALDQMFSSFGDIGKAVGDMARGIVESIGGFEQMAEAMERITAARLKGKEASFSDQIAAFQGGVGMISSLVGVLSTIGNLFRGGPSERERERMRIEQENNERIHALTLAIEGWRLDMNALAKVSRIGGALDDPRITFILGRMRAASIGPAQTPQWWERAWDALDEALTPFGLTMGEIDAAAEELGITIRDSAGRLIPEALDQLAEAAEKAARAAFTWTNTLENLRTMEDLRQRVAGEVNRTPQDTVTQELGFLQQLAPELFNRFFAGVDLGNAEQVREALKVLTEAFLTNAIDWQAFGGIMDKEEMESIISAVADALNEMGAATQNVTEALRNVPEIYKIASARFAAMTDEVVERAWVQQQRTQQQMPVPGHQTPLEPGLGFKKLTATDAALTRIADLNRSTDTTLSKMADLSLSSNEALTEIATILREGRASGGDTIIVQGDVNIDAGQQDPKTLWEAIKGEARKEKRRAHRTDAYPFRDIQ